VTRPGPPGEAGEVTVLEIIDAGARFIESEEHPSFGSSLQLRSNLLFCHVPVQWSFNTRIFFSNSYMDCQRVPLFRSS